MRGATFATRSSLILFIISIHAPHARSDLRTLSASTCIPYFNPRSSCEERQLGVKFVKRVIPISIHAPHARSDCGEVMRGWMLMSISIHAPHARSDSDGRPMGIPSYISIHAPHARSDDAQIRFSAIPSEISIHAPHARSDRHARRCVQGIQNFNPRSSCEERRHSRATVRGCSANFNPRSSCEERPLPCSFSESVMPISIHAPHARSDAAFLPAQLSLQHFNPRSSCEERQMP